MACATNGDLFCRECAINDLLAQHQEIKRLEREREDAKQRIEEEEQRTLEEAREREVKEFELVSMGLEGSRRDKRKGNGPGGGSEEGRKRKIEEMEALSARSKEEEKGEGDGGKRRRVFSLDERGVVGEERERIRRELKREKVCFPFLIMKNKRKY